MWRVMGRMVTGEAEMREIDMLLDVASQVEGHTICGLGDAAALADPRPFSAISATRWRNGSPTTGSAGRMFRARRSRRE